MNSTGGRRVTEWGSAAVLVAVLASCAAGCASRTDTSAADEPIPAVADRWTMVVDGTSDAPVAEASFELENLGPACGTPWDLAPGVTVHDADRAPDVSALLEASAWIVTDNDDLLPPTEVWAGYYTLHGRLEDSLHQASQPYRWLVAPVLLKGGAVAAAGPATGIPPGTAGSDDSIATGFSGILPGMCPGGDLPTWDDGEYQAFWVAQAVDQADGTPILTVSMPFESNPVEFSDLAAWWGVTPTPPSATATPTALEATPTPS